VTLDAPRADDAEPRVLWRHVGALRRRLWLERVLGLEARALAIGFGVALAVAVGAWATLTPLVPVHYGGPVAAAVGLALLSSLFRYPSPMDAAKAADRRLGLRERIGTAVELAGLGVQGSLARRQLATAVDAAGWARQNWRAGPSAGRDLAVAAGLGLLAAAVILVSSLEDRLPAAIPRPSIWSLLPGDPSSAERAATDDPAGASGPATLARAETSGRTAAVVRSLEDLRRARQSGAIGAGEAADRMAQAESELSRQTQDSRTQREALDRLGRALDQVAAGRPAAERIQRGEYGRAGEEITTLGTESDQLSPQAKAQLAQALRSAAAESQAAPDLAARERRAADALPGRDYEPARRAMKDLGDEVARRGQNVIPQQELAQAWDRLDEERRSQGPGDNLAAAQRQARSNGSQQAPQAPRSAPGSQSSASAPGSEPGDAGPGDPEASGPGDGEGADPVGAASLTPGAQSVGEFQPAGQARRLDVQGRPVEVDVQPGQQPGQRAGDQDPRNERPSDQLGAISAISGEAPGRVSAAVPAESNFVPSERRQVVRDYFSSGEGR